MDKIEVIDEVSKSFSGSSFFQVIAGIAIVYFLYDSFKKNGSLKKIEDAFNKLKDKL